MNPTNDGGRFSLTDWRVLALIGSVALLVLASVLYVQTGARSQQPARDQNEASRFGTLGVGVDDVTLVDSSGETQTWAALNRRPRAVFFGFTHCPEICPTTVMELGAAMEEIGPAARDLRVDFVSVDPARDTPAVLSDYFASFGPQFHGLTGEKEEIDRLVRSFGAFYEMSPDLSGGYTVNHTAITYLVDTRGRVVDIIGYGTPHERVVAQVRAFLEQNR